MNSNFIQAWLAKFNVGTHSYAGIALAIGTMYASSASFRNWCGQLLVVYQAHVPAIWQPVPVFAFLVWQIYRNPHAAALE